MLNKKGEVKSKEEREFVKKFKSLKGYSEGSIKEYINYITVCGCDF